VPVSVEFEGPSPAIRNVILAVENQMPFLFVAAASLRSVTDGDDSLIRAELKVEGAMRDDGSSANPAEAISQ
jgi:general secretion pathway protein M